MEDKSKKEASYPQWRKAGGEDVAPHRIWTAGIYKNCLFFARPQQ